MRGAPVSAWGLGSTSRPFRFLSLSLGLDANYRGEHCKAPLILKYTKIFESIPVYSDSLPWIGLASCSVPDRANCYLAKSKCRTLRFPHRRHCPPISNSVTHPEIRVQSILRILIMIMLNSMALQEPWSENAPSLSRAYLAARSYGT